MADPAYIVDGVLEDGEAWIAISSTTLTGTAAVTLTSPEDGSSTDWAQFMDLVCIIYAKGSAGAGDAYTTAFARYRPSNSASYDNGANYSRQSLAGNGAATAATSSATDTYVNLGEIPSNNGTANIFGAIVFTMFDINSGKYKSSLVQTASDRDGAGQVQLWATTWRNQHAITGINFECGSNFLAGSRFDLFGVLPRMVA